MDLFEKGEEEENVRGGGGGGGGGGWGRRRRRAGEWGEWRRLVCGVEVLNGVKGGVERSISEKKTKTNIPFLTKNQRRRRDTRKKEPIKWHNRSSNLRKIHLSLSP